MLKYDGKVPEMEPLVDEFCRVSLELTRVVNEHRDEPMAPWEVVRAMGRKMETQFDRTIGEIRSSTSLGDDTP